MTNFCEKFVVRLSEYVSQLVRQSEMQCGDDTFEDLVLDIVTILLDMPLLLMKCGVACNKDDELVVIVHRYRCLRDKCLHLEEEFDTKPPHMQCLPWRGISASAREREKTFCFKDFQHRCNNR